MSEALGVMNINRLTPDNQLSKITPMKQNQLSFWY